MLEANNEQLLQVEQTDIKVQRNKISEYVILKQDGHCCADLQNRWKSYLFLVFLAFLLAASISAVYTFLSSVERLRVTKKESLHTYDGISCIGEKNGYCNRMAREMSLLANNISYYNDSNSSISEKVEPWMYTSWNCHYSAQLHLHNRTLFKFEPINSIAVILFLCTGLYSLFIMIHDCSLLYSNGMADFTMNRVIKQGYYPCHNWLCSLADYVDCAKIFDKVDFIVDLFKRHYNYKCHWIYHCICCPIYCYILLVAVILIIVIYIIVAVVIYFFFCSKCYGLAIKNIRSYLCCVCDNNGFLCTISAWATACLRSFVSICAWIFLFAGLFLQEELDLSNWDKSDYGFNKSIECTCYCNYYLSGKNFGSFLAVAFVI
ncbi:hypothetical protein RFI_24165, partial [Reticulomyxa filosa]